MPSSKLLGFHNSQLQGRSFQVTQPKRWWIDKWSSGSRGFPGVSVVKNPSANAGDAEDTGSIPGLRRSPREGNGNPLQYSCLGNPMEGGTWWATVHGVAKSWTWLSTPVVALCLMWSLFSLTFYFCLESESVLIYSKY